jgi:hypothetical protein
MPKRLLVGLTTEAPINAAKLSAPAPANAKLTILLSFATI